MHFKKYSTTRNHPTLDHFIIHRKLNLVVMGLTQMSSGAAFILSFQMPFIGRKILLTIISHPIR